MLKIDVWPESRLEDVKKFFPTFNLASPPIGPCGGYTRSYTSTAESTGIAVRGDLSWSVAVPSFPPT